MPRRADSLLRAGLGAAFAALLLLAACGSREPSEAAGERPSPAAGAAREHAARKPDPRPVLVAFGDSLTSGHRVPPGETYPALLQREFDRRGIALRVVNEGVSGDTTAKALSRLDAAIAHDPAWVVLALGANDGLRGLPLDAMEANLRDMIRRLLDSGARVVLAGMKLPRNYGPEYVGRFDAVYPRLAEELDLPLIPFLLEDVAMVRELNNDDGIHPNAKGNEVVARQVADFLEGLTAN